MYINKIEITNIRSIKHFSMTFKSPAGWHVLIGDNGAGKSSIIRSIALCILGVDNAKALSSFEDFANWLPPDTEKGSITIKAERDNSFDMPAYGGSKVVTSEINLEAINDSGRVNVIGKISPKNALWGEYGSSSGWFFAAYGPFRRLRGGVDVFAHVGSSRPRLGACLTAFRDDVALTQLTAWLKDLALDAQKKLKAKKTLDSIIKFINSAKLLPGDAVLLDDIDSDGIKLKDSNGVAVSLLEMSDGYRSVLSMTIDIIRFLIEIYGVDKVFSSEDQSSVNLPGVILIDEVDAHLHPTWQTEIGGWFIKHFPNIQFIVTTHSPLVCRAAETGSIWRLAAPGKKDHLSGEITGVERERLIFGNVLDAYGTEIFGKSPVRSKASKDKLEKLGKLNMMAALGTIKSEEEKEREELQKILSTDDPTGI